MNQQTTAPLPPNDALKVFTPLIGVWSTTGSHGMIADTILHGQTTFEWQDGFIRVHSFIQEDVGIPVGTAIIGSDDELSTYTMSYYDDRGISRIYTVSMEGTVMKWWRDAPRFSQRYSLTISEDGRTMIGRGELCRDGSTWEKDLDLNYQRVS